MGGVDLEIVEHVAGQERAGGHQTGQPAQHAAHQHPDIAIGEYGLPGFQALTGHKALFGCFSRRRRRGYDLPEHEGQEETGDEEDRKDQPPAHEMQEVPHQNRGEAKTEENQGRLLQADIAPVAILRRNGYGGGDRGGRIGPVRKAHQHPYEHEPQERGRKTAGADQQGEYDQRAGQDYALADAVRKIAHDQGGETPGDRQGPGDHADPAIGQVQVMSDSGEHGRDQEPVDSDEAKAEGQGQNAPKFLLRILNRGGGHHADLSFCAFTRCSARRLRKAAISPSVQGLKPSPVLKPSLPSRTFSSRNSCGPECRSSSGIMVR